MTLALFYTKRVRQALAAPAKVGIDLLVLGLMAAVVGGVVMFGRQVSAPFAPQANIDLSFWSLPKYTLFSLSRGFAAYILSLAFTLVYGTIAAHNQRAEKIMIPVLDVLQAIPVLGFLPALVVAMVNLFPTRELGLELACVVMIFTGQVWNMTFSFHGSLRSIPEPMREVAKVQRLNGWQTFKLLEVPAAMIGLVWNSMMSMAGGWFFLTVNEAFTLGDHDYRLPGIGSYMSEAIKTSNVSAMWAAIAAMIIMIVVVDQVFWRPIVVWSQRFKMEELSGADKPQSWVLNLLERSRLYKWMGRQLSRRKARAHAASMPPAADEEGGAVATAVAADPPAAARKVPSAESGRPRWVLPAVNWTLVGLIGLGALAGGWALIRLLSEVSGGEWGRVALSLGASFLRTTWTVVLGAAWALPVGILIGLSPRLSERLQPLIQVVASFPAPMLFPLVTLLLLKLNVSFEIGCVALMLLGAQWYILFNVIAGAMAIPSDLKEVCDVYRMSRVQRWTRLYIPCVFPYLVTGLVTAAGGAWNATIVSEYVQAPVNGEPHTFVAFGLGSLISKATESGNMPLLAAAVLAMAVFVVIINRFFWKWLYRLAEDRYSLNT